VCPFYCVSGGRQLSRNVPADAGFCCDKAAVLGDTLKGHPWRLHHEHTHVLNCVVQLLVTS